MKHENILLTDDEEGRELTEDIMEFFSLSEDDIDKLMNELENKGDSFSTSHIIDLFDTDIDIVERASNLVMYIIHKMNFHDLPIQSIEEELGRLSLDGKKLTLFFSKLKNLSTRSKSAIEKLYYTNLQKMEGDYSQSIYGYENFALIKDEDDSFLGLAPMIKIRMEVVAGYDGEVKVVEIQHTLDSLYSMISKLRHIYRNAYMNAESIREKSEPPVICIPKDNPL